LFSKWNQKKALSFPHQLYKAWLWVVVGPKVQHTMNHATRPTIATTSDKSHTADMTAFRVCSGPQPPNVYLQRGRAYDGPHSFTSQRHDYPGRDRVSDVFAMWRRVVTGCNLLEQLR